MSKKRLAMTKDGQLTYCTASEENIGKGRCNHIAHQKNGEDPVTFMNRVNNAQNASYDKKIEMIQKGENLNILINDEDYEIRRVIAEQGYGLDKLINDEDWGVRKIVAEQGYGLDKLVNDKHSNVRAAVADHGYGLDKLANDENYLVRQTVKEYKINERKRNKIIT